MIWKASAKEKPGICSALGQFLNNLSWSISSPGESACLANPSAYLTPQHGQIPSMVNPLACTIPEHGHLLTTHRLGSHPGEPIWRMGLTLSDPRFTPKWCKLPKLPNKSVYPKRPYPNRASLFQARRAYLRYWDTLLPMATHETQSLGMHNRSAWSIPQFPQYGRFVSMLTWSSLPPWRWPGGFPRFASLPQRKILGALLLPGLKIGFPLHEIERSNPSFPGTFSP
eukprot:213437-Pelagomonas_calceolata.AAC.2